MMTNLRKGKIRPNDQIRQCLDENRHVIEFAETAADIRECDWGHDISKGLDVLVPELSRLRLTAFMLTAKAHILAQEGDQRASLAKFLTIHKMARHVGDSLLLSYLVNIGLNGLASNHIQHLLSTMPQDLETLLWLRSQMIAVSVDTPSIKVAMAREKEISMQEIREEKIENFLKIRGDDFAGDKTKAAAVEKVRRGDAKFFRDNRQYYAGVMDDVIAAMDLPYQQAHRRLQELTARIEEDVKTNQSAIMATLLTPASCRVHTLGTKSDTLFNATRAAIEIYVVRAKTGRLPDRLPANLPKDLFSGEDFEYSKRKDGFTLRCRGKDLDEGEAYQYEFEVAE
ncbi:MAG: hypothetical protein JSW47_11545 [Phycisphaerales bacterium]|nr:MAG: hypothetical protein JSW47_11545 [Phycisphaerales bacterium]